MLFSGQTPAEWLKFNYDLSIGDEFKLYTNLDETVVIKNIKEADGKSHFPTQYPVIVGIHYEDSISSEKTLWITIESIFKY